jgi:large subunit ribosomal protein L24
MAARIRKGDRVVVIAGRDKGRVGEVLRVIPKEERVVVQGAQIVRKHQKPGPRTGSGGIVSQEAPIHVSNVAHLDPQDGKPTRIGFRHLEDGRKVRFAKRSGELIDR